MKLNAIIGYILQINISEFRLILLDHITFEKRRYILHGKTHGRMQSAKVLIRDIITPQDET